MTASAATKKRCWSFHVTGVNRKKGSKIKEASVLASFRERYTAVKRMALSSSTTTTTSTVNDAKSSPGGVGSSKTVCIEVQFIGPQPSQGPAALLCNLLSGTSVEARPIELRRGRDNKRKRQDSGYDEESHSAIADGREGKVARPNVLHRRKELHERASLITKDTSSVRHLLPTQDIRSQHDHTTAYIKVSDDLEQVPAPLTRPIYMTPLSLKGLASFPAHPSTPLNEIPPSTPPSQVPPSTPPSDVPVLPLLGSRTDVLPLMKSRDDALPSSSIRNDSLPLSTARDDAPLPSLAPRNRVVFPSLNTRNNGVPPPSTSSNTAGSLTTRRIGVPSPSTPENSGVASPSTPSNEVSAPSDTRMHWEDVIGRIDAPPPSRSLLERQHSLDIGDITSSSDGDGDGDDTDGEIFSSTGSTNKKRENDEEGATAAMAGRDNPINYNADGIGCSHLYDPPLMFGMAEELLDSPSGSVPQQGLPSESTRPFGCARGILRGSSFQYSDHIGLDDIHSTYGPHEDSFAEHSRDSGGLSSATLSDCGVVNISAEGEHLVSSLPTPAQGSCGATGQPNVVVGLLREFQECDFEGHHLLSSSNASTFSGDHYQLVIDGLEDVGHAPQDLVTTAHFSVDSSYKVGRRASPIRVGGNGKSHAALFYPSMQAIWPEVYIANNVRAVEVDITIDIRSLDGTFHHTTPNLKVIYRRSPF